MNFLKCIRVLPLVVTVCWAQQSDIGIAWEQQIRPWVSAIPQMKAPEVLIRFFPGGESREELFALYINSRGESVAAFARTREINAQAFSNTFINELHQSPPSIPIELKAQKIDRHSASQLVADVDLYLQRRPESWKMLAQMGHGGSFFVSTKDSSFLYEGPVDSRSSAEVARLISRVSKIRTLLEKSRSVQLFEFPALKQLTQWRFCRALMQGDVQLSIYLLSLGADPNRDPRFPETPIEHAIRGGHKELLSVLLNLGADPEAKTSDGLTPVELALETKNQWAVPLLQSSTQGHK